jgi:hypothetical protein
MYSFEIHFVLSGGTAKKRGTKFDSMSIISSWMKSSEFGGTFGGTPILPNAFSAEIIA